MQQIILHIGTNKTGTSSLQDFLYLNRRQLTEAGYHYPDLRSVTGSTAHHAISRICKGASPKTQGLSESWLNDIVQDAKDAQCHTLLLSSEDFHTIKDLSKLKEYFSPYQVKAVVYLRDYVSYITSWYQQAIHSRNLTMSFQEFIEYHKSHYSDLLCRWIDAFGKASLDVNIYERKSLHQQDITKDFISKLPGTNHNDFSPIDGDRNPSITGNLLFFKRILNQFITKAESHSITEEIDELSLTNERYQGKMYVSEEHIKRINWLYKKDVQFLDREFNLTLSVRNEPLQGEVSPDMGTLKDNWKEIISHIEKKQFRTQTFLSRIPF